MPKYIVVFETTYAPQTNVSLVDAESAEDARQQLEAQAPPPGAGIDLLVTNVIPLDSPPAQVTGPETTTTEAPTEPKLALVE
jgi:hypothetical protein